MSWDDLVLEAAKDSRVLIVILFFVGIYLIVASVAEFQLGPIKSINPENRGKVFRYGIVVSCLSGLILAALLVNSMGVEVSGKIEYTDGLPVRNAYVYIGNHSRTTNPNGLYKIPDVPRDESQITIIIADKSYNDVIDIPKMWLWIDKEIPIMPINLSVSGSVRYEDEYPAQGAYVNISGGISSFTKTDSNGAFDFGKNLVVNFVPSKPLILEVRLPDELRPRNKTNLNIPEREPYAIYLPIILPPKDQVDVSGYVHLKDSISDMNPKGLPSAVVEMGERTAQTKNDGSYYIVHVPIKTTKYALWFEDGTILGNRTIPSRLVDSYINPRIENLSIYRSEVNTS